MKACASIRLLLLGAFCLAIAGCTSYPVSKSLREQAKPLTIGQVAANPSAYSGTVVIWGGRVIQTVNDTNGGAIYVLALPLHKDESPVRHGVSTGRFIVRGKRFIDPEVFSKGRLITVAGRIAGVEAEPLQQIEYPYPVVAIEELHAWYVRPYYSYPYYGWYGPGWGWYGPGWGWGWGPY